MKEKQSLEQLKKERAEYLEGWQRERADLANYKREARDLLEKSCEAAKEKVLRSLLPILDTLELAENSAEDRTHPVVRGFLQIARQLQEFFNEQGIGEVETKGLFNPELHEAVGEEHREGVSPGTVSQVVAKGYELEGKLLRPAKVKVAK